MAKITLTREQKLEHTETLWNNPSVQFLRFKDKGLTIAYTLLFVGSRLIKVAVSVPLREGEIYSKSKGDCEALNSLLGGECLTLPSNFNLQSLALGMPDL